MQDLQEFQNVQNENIERLKEQLQHFNIKVSLHDNEEEPIQKPKTKPTKNKNRIIIYQKKTQKKQKRNQKKKD